MYTILTLQKVKLYTNIVEVGPRLWFRGPTSTMVLNYSETWLKNIACNFDFFGVTEYTLYILMNDCSAFGRAFF